MRISLVQMNPTADKSENIAQAARLIDAAVAADGPHLVALPELWTIHGGERETKFAAAEELPPADAASNVAGGVAYEFLRETARRHRVHVHGGSIGERQGDRLFNTSLVFGPDGQEVARYRKIHLFDVVTPDGLEYKESATYGAGDKVVTFTADGMTLGCAICYDLRFPELFLQLRRAQADVIFVPAAFTVHTGRDHWEVLLRARAIETQCWIAASATWGSYTDKGRPRATYGHSLLADPWGHVVARASDGVGWTTGRVDRDLIGRVRRDMPVLEHRRLV